MTVHFDPKNNSARQIVQDSPARNMAAPLEDPYADPTATISEMDLLFSGTRRISKEPIQVPELERDLFGAAPILGSTSTSVNNIISHYQLLRKNLVDRRNNYSHALESYLQPEEAFDLSGRIEEIDKALDEIERNLERAYHQKNDLEYRENQNAIAENARQANQNHGGGSGS